jgi:anti-sigma factor RsiW
MAEVDQQLDEMLSAYVDGELSPAEQETLTRRLEAEPTLATAIEALRAGRAARAALWQSCEPDEAAVGRLIDRVDRAIDRHTVWAYRLSRIRIASAAAACIVLGIIIGRVTFGPGAAQPVDRLVTQGSVTGQTVSNPIIPEVPVQVRIVDGRGQQVMIQPFKTREEAEQFILDLQQWQQEQEQIKSGGGGIVPAGSERF